jgi:hypothetical protein
MLMERERSYISFYPKVPITVPDLETGVCHLILLVSDWLDAIVRDKPALFSSGERVARLRRLYVRHVSLLLDFMGQGPVDQAIVKRFLHRYNIQVQAA